RSLFCKAARPAIHRRHSQRNQHGEGIFNRGIRRHLPLRGDPSRVSHEATELAEKLGGYFVDQFSNAATVVDWRGEESLASDFLNQMRFEPFPVPASVVVGAGTGGTSVGIAKYLRYCGHATEVVVVDPEGSAFYQAWVTGDRSVE